MKPYLQDADFTECEPYGGYIGTDGYARRTILAHRLAWLEQVGPIPKGYELHHVCGVTSCVNIEHLRLVTPQEHKALEQSERTHCRRGHPYLEEGHTRANGRRYCRACERENRRRRAALS